MKTTKQNKMLAFVLFASLLLLLTPIFASVDPKLELMNYTLSESPAQPGHTVSLTLHFKSVEWDNCAERTEVQLAVSYPLSLLGSDSQYLGTLCLNDTAATDTVTFSLPVDNLALSGTYPVAVTTTYQKRFTKYSASNTINLRVGGSPAFSASVTGANPVDLYPGEGGTVTVTFQNIGPSTVQSARASVTTTSPLEIKWAGQSQDLGQITARASAPATFSIEVPKDLAAGTYPLDVRLDYTSEDRSAGSSLFHFEVPVHPQAEFLASFKDGPGMLSGEQKVANITLTNTGSESAKKLKVRIKPIFPFSTDGTVRYVESLSPGQSVDLGYLLTVDKDATPGQQLLGVLVDYENPQGKKFSDSADFAMNVRSPTLNDTLMSYWYMGVLAALAVVFVLVRKLRGKKKE